MTAKATPTPTLQLLPDVVGAVSSDAMVSVIVGGDVLMRAAEAEPGVDGGEPLGTVARLLLGCGFSRDAIAVTFEADERAATDLSIAVQLLAKLKLIGKTPTLGDATHWLSLVIALREVVSPNDTCNRARITFSTISDFRCEVHGGEGWVPASEADVLGINGITVSQIARAIMDVRDRRARAEAPPAEQSLARMGGALDELARESWPG